MNKGSDAFGRKTLVAAFGKPVKIEQAPFYAFHTTAYILGTYGGILTNERAQVVDIFGQTVPGLYAAGEIVGGVHGAACMTGTTSGRALIFGRITAKSVPAQKQTGHTTTEGPGRCRALFSHIAPLSDKNRARADFSTVHSQDRQTVMADVIRIQWFFVLQGTVFI